MARLIVKAGDSIQAAIDKAEPGDVIVAGGIVHERLRFLNSGTPSKPITLQAKPGETLWIDGRNTIKYCIEFGDYNGGDPLPVDYIELNRVRVIRAQSHGVLSRPGCQGLVLRNVEACNNGWNGIYLFPDLTDEPGRGGDHVISRCTANFNHGHGIKTGGVNILIEDCEAMFNNRRRTDEHRDGCGIQASDRNWEVHIHRCLLIGNYRDGLRYCAKGGKVRDIKTGENGRDGINVAGERLPASDIDIDSVESFRNGRHGIMEGANVVNVTWGGDVEIYDNVREAFAKEA